MKNGIEFSHYILTVKSMFESRNYINIQGPVTVKINNTLLITELIAKYNNHRNKRTEDIRCIFIPFDDSKLTSSIGKTDMHNYCKNTTNNSHLIFIVNNVSFQAYDYLSRLPLYWEILTYEDIICDKSKHIYVPEYKILTEPEIKHIEKKFGDRSKFNKMIVKVDAMAKYFDFRVDDVVKLTKNSSIGGFVEGYRFLVRERDIV